MWGVVTNTLWHLSCAQICPQSSLQRAQASGSRVVSGSCEQKQKKREAFSHYTCSKKPEQTLQQCEQLTTNPRGRHTSLFHDKSMTRWGWDSSVCPGRMLSGGVADVVTAQLRAPWAVGSQSLLPRPKRQHWRCRQRSVSLSWGAREVGSPCEWRGRAPHCSRAMVFKVRIRKIQRIPCIKHSWSWTLVSCN